MGFLFFSQSGYLLFWPVAHGVLIYSKQFRDRNSNQATTTSCLIFSSLLSDLSSVTTQTQLLHKQTLPLTWECIYLPRLHSADWPCLLTTSVLTCNPNTCLDFVTKSEAIGWQNCFFSSLLTPTFWYCLPISPLFCYCLTYITFLSETRRLVTEFR
jgi:hypothetical protein